jgi:hypothetical protein
MAVFERPRALALAVRSLDPALCSRIFDAIGSNDAALATLLADAALETMTAQRQAERRAVAEVAAREAQRRAALAPPAIDEEETIRKAADSLTAAVMAKSRSRYRNEVRHG